MELGDSTTAERDQRSVMDTALDRFDSALTDVISAVETSGFDHLKADQQVAVWQRFETIRNKLPLVDHQLITAADAADLPRQYCSATMTQFLVRILQLPHGEAAARVRAAAAVGPAPPCSGNGKNPLLPGLAVLQRQGVVSAVKVQIVERAMHQLTRPSIDPEAVETAELFSPSRHPSWRRRSCKGSPTLSSLPQTPTGPNRSMISCNKTGGMWSSRSAATACGSCGANSPTPSVPS
jgi:hypothetical protein